jgi:anti-sigma factor RsiW
MRCQKWHIQILRWQDGELDHEAEAALLRHLETCAHCRIAAEKFSELDRFLLEVPAPPVPTFLSERIIAQVTDEMRQDSLKGAFHHFTAFFTNFRPALVGIILALGIGLGVLMGLNLSHSISTSPAGASYDVLALAGMESGGGDSSLDFIWTDANGGAR